MKKQFLLFGTLLALVFGLSGLNAQAPLKYCGTQELHNEYVLTHPEVLDQERNQNEYTERFREEENKRRTPPPVYIIPVVFHVLHEYGPENISDAQIFDQMQILNRDFRKLNSDTALVVPSFQGLIADCEIEFRLATLDPNGNCTNGIERIFTSETQIGDNGSKLNQWPRDRYMNVWVVNNISSGAAGYSQYPSAVTGQNYVNDGIMILAAYVGSIGTGSVGTSRALTHEVGHYLNLQHCWGSTNAPGVACGNDFCNDTPETKGWSGCNLSGSVCNPPIIENVQNYMEYSYCTRMFTPDQKSRMRAALTNTAQWPFRANLWNSNNLTQTGALVTPAPVCVPVADFKSEKIFICTGTTITYNDFSWKGAPSSWSWTFPGGNPSSSTSQNPSVQYSTPGVYDVTLTVTNSAGTNTLTRTAHVTVSNAAGLFNPPYSESFETLNIPGNDWYIVDDNGGNSWLKTSMAAKTGTYSMMKNNFSGNPNGVDNFITTSFDFNYIINVNMTFQLAFALKSASATSEDQLRVFSSTDCGKIWSTRMTKKGTALSTAGVVGNSTFIPNQNQWALQTINMASGLVSTQTNVRFKFEFTYDVGNNIYIDDININGTLGIDPAQAEQLNMTVVPNPSADAPVVYFNLNKSQQVSVVVNDLLGRTVDTVNEQYLEAGEHQYQLTGNLKAGVYFVRLYLGDFPVTKKIIIE